MSNKDQSTLIVNYCLGLLTGDIKISFERNMKVDPDLLVQVEAMKYRLLPLLKSSPSAKAPEGLKDKTWALIDNVNREKNMDVSDLPLLNKYTDTAAWSSVVMPRLPKNLDKSRPYMKVLTANERVTQVLIATSFDFPEEEHGDLLESFIILEGECECRVGADTVRVRAGGYLEIPLHTSHDVRIVSEGIVGILQRINLTDDADKLLCAK